MNTPSPQQTACASTAPLAKNQRTQLSAEPPAGWDSFKNGLEISPIVSRSPNMGFRVRFPCDMQFESSGSLFHYLRYALSQHLGGRYLSIKFASLIVTLDVPVIHDPDQDQLCFYHDPLFVYRDIVEHANSARFVDLHRLPSKAGYFRKKAKQLPTHQP